MNRVHRDRTICANIHRGQHKDNPIKQGVLAHSFRAKRLLGRNDAQDVMTQHVLGLKNLDLIIRDSLKNRSLVLVTLGGDLTKTSDAPFINRSINRQRENDTNTIRQ